jgi:transcriptional regulator GlxA family with amidase domain
MALAPVIRHLQVHAAMASLLGEVLEDFDHIPSQSVEMPALARLWWEVEAKVRKRVGQPLTLPELAELSDRSQATLARACHAAVGMAPMKRLKHIRMNLAQGLLYRSDLSIKEVSARLGYDRLHEFSRDYRKHFGTSPRHDREQHRAINAP